MIDSKIYIGAHISIAGGIYKACERADEIGCTCMQIFTANQRRWDTKPISKEDVALFKEGVQKTGLKHIMSHSSYLINLGSPKQENLVKSRAAFASEIDRCLALGLDYLNFHPGAALDSTEQQCLDQIIESVLSMEKQLAGSDLTLVFETTAGQGSVVGYNFEQLGYLVKGVSDKINIGVCIDTAHVFAAGYDIRSQEGIDRMFADFENHMPLSYLKALHINDSKCDLGTRKDRHEYIGEGKIGLTCFEVLMNHPATRHLPKYLETPGGGEEWKKEISMLKLKKATTL